MTVEERTATLAVLYAQLFPNDDSEARPAIDAQHLRLSDDEVIERAHRAVNGDKLQRLWSGNLSDHGMDHSRADLALCCLLAYHTNDPVQIDRLFRQSGLMREKWDRQDYRVRTLARAVALAMSASIPDGVMPGPGVNVTAAQLNADWTGDF
jgi:primase-polymerase (primpol)-like protein